MAPPCPATLTQLKIKENLPMSETADIIIIGGGVMSASIAYHLAKQGDRQVMLQEQVVDNQIIQPEEGSDAAQGYSGNGVALACYEPGTGVADPMATTHCFAKRARDFGATIHEGVTVTQILIANERVVGVRTDAG